MVRHETPQRRTVLGPELPAHAVDFGGGDAEAPLEVLIDAPVDARDDAEGFGVQRVVEIEEEDRHGGISDRYAAPPPRGRGS